MEVRLPEIAEGVDKGEVLTIMVKEGDEVEQDAPLLELESEKATVPVPSPAKGRITKILVRAGQTVKVGQSLVVLEEGDGATPASQPLASDAKPEGGATAESAERNVEDSAEDTTSDSQAEPSAPGEAAPLGGHGEGGGAPQPAPAPAPESGGETSRGAVLPAGPAVRRIARELGLDLSQVRGSGRNGRITVEDLDPYIRSHVATHAGPGAALPRIEMPDFSRWGPVRKERADATRRKISERLSQAWLTVPHVHQFHETDVTSLLAMQKRHKEQVKERGGQLTLTPFLMKAIVIALKEFPQFNCSFDGQSGTIFKKDYWHIGVAVDTEQGLIVPVVRDVDKKNIIELAKEVSELAQRARERKLTIDQLRGSTFTISNLGSIGGSHFTPIVNPPDVAILGVGRARKRPFWNGQMFEPRDLLPLCLGYDHRVIDGAHGARFIVRLGDILENFEATLLGF
jgi:pyruvate dehydrogenase E2 component (dihydrolipoamide acetyltransferase)